MGWGDAFTGAGVLIALIALLYTRSVSRRQTELAQQQTDVQARLTAIEEGRRADEVEARRHARVVPAFRRPEPNRLRFVLTNQGPAPARDVRCQLQTLDGRHHREWWASKRCRSTCALDSRWSSSHRPVWA